jgi:uncharacterized protein YbjT (DUF2867 family)
LSLLGSATPSRQFRAGNTKEQHMIVVTSPTGNISSHLLKRLVAADEPVRVIARDPARLAPDLRERVQVVQGSHREASVVDAAFDGADAVFWLVPADRQAPSVQDAYGGFAAAGIEALTTHGVRHVVGVSALGRGTSVGGRAGHVTATLAMDDQIGQTGVNYRALANASFMDNTLRDVQPIKTRGEMAGTLTADRAYPLVATKDIADVAAELLLKRDWTGVEEVPLLGPEDLTAVEIAAIISDVLSTPVAYRQRSAETLKSGLSGFMSEPMAQAMVDMMVAKDADLDTGVRRTPEISARTPTTFRTWCREVLKPAYDAAA